MGPPDNAAAPSRPADRIPGSTTNTTYIPSAIARACRASKSVGASAGTAAPPLPQLSLLKPPPPPPAQVMTLEDEVCAMRAAAERQQQHQQCTHHNQHQSQMQLGEAVTGSSFVAVGPGGHEQEEYGDGSGAGDRDSDSSLGERAGSGEDADGGLGAVAIDGIGGSRDVPTATAAAAAVIATEQAGSTEDEAMFSLPGTCVVRLLASSEGGGSRGGQWGEGGQRVCLR